MNEEDNNFAIDAKKTFQNGRRPNDQLAKPSNVLNTIIAHCDNDAHLSQTPSSGGARPARTGDKKEKTKEKGHEGADVNETTNKEKQENIKIMEVSMSAENIQTKRDNNDITSAQLVREDDVIEGDNNDGTNVCRVYRGTVTFSVEYSARHFCESINTYYRIACPNSIKRALTSPTGMGQARVPQFSCQVVMIELLASEFASYAKKYSTFTANHSYADLSAVIEQLGAMLAVYSNTGKLSYEDACGGRVVRLHALQQHTITTVPSCDGVFIPQTLNSHHFPYVLSALTAAITACGGTVITDIVSTNATGTQAHLVTTDNDTLAFAAYQALLILGKNYEDNSASDIFALALTRGLHRVNSVVGHTDEGAWFRKVLRCGAFSRPYGGVMIGQSSYCALACPIGGSISSWRQLTDSLLLATAALVAECDPGVLVKETLVPTVLACERGVSEKDFGRINHSNILLNFGEFATLYTDGLVQLLGMRTNSQKARNVLVGCAGLERVARDRHLAYSNISPYYWIEPTGIINSPLAGISKRSRAFGAITYRSEVDVRVGVPDAGITASFGHEYDVVMKYINMRHNWLLLWAASRDGDGLAQISLLGLDSTRLCNLGPNLTQMDFMDEARVEFLVMHRMRWRVGDCVFPRPAEALYVGGDIKVAIKWGWTPGLTTSTMYNTQLTCMPTVKDFTTCRFSATTDKLEHVMYDRVVGVYSERQQYTSKAIREIQANLISERCTHMPRKDHFFKNQAVEEGFYTPTGGLGELTDSSGAGRSGHIVIENATPSQLKHKVEKVPAQGAVFIQTPQTHPERGTVQSVSHVRTGQGGDAGVGNDVPDGGSTGATNPEGTPQ